MDGGQSGATRRRSFGILRSLNKNDNHLDALAEEIEMHQQLSDSSGSSHLYVEEGNFEDKRVQKLCKFYLRGRRTLYKYKELRKNKN